MSNFDILQWFEIVIKMDEWNKLSFLCIDQCWILCIEIIPQVSSYGTKEMTLDSGEKVVIPEVVRTLCHSNLVQMYHTFCEETGFTPLSKSSLFQILRICPASKKTSLRGLDNVAVDGASAFETLNEVIKQLKTSFTQ